jgi:hypothetical protein
MPNRWDLDWVTAVARSLIRSKCHRWKAYRTVFHQNGWIHFIAASWLLLFTVTFRVFVILQQERTETEKHQIKGRIWNFRLPRSYYLFITVSLLLAVTFISSVKVDIWPFLPFFSLLDCPCPGALHHAVGGYEQMQRKEHILFAHLLSFCVD